MIINIIIFHIIFTKRIDNKLFIKKYTSILQPMMYILLGDSVDELNMKVYS